MSGGWLGSNPYDKEQSDINFSTNHYGRRLKDKHPTVFPRVSIYGKKDKDLYCIPCKHQTHTNAEFVTHLQSAEHTRNLYTTKSKRKEIRKAVKAEYDENKRHERGGSSSGSGSKSRSRSGSRSSSESKSKRKSKSKDPKDPKDQNDQAATEKIDENQNKDTYDGKRKSSKKSKRRRHSSSSEDDRRRSRSSKKSKKSQKSKKSKKSKKSRRRRYSSSDSYDSESSYEERAQKEARYDRERKRDQKKLKDQKIAQPAGLAAEVRIAIAQAEARARDLARTDEEALAKNTNVFGKAQDRIKAEAEKDVVKAEAVEGAIMSLSEHKLARPDQEKDVDFVQTMKGDGNLMEDDAEEEMDKGEIEITPIIEVKPRTKLSFIAPRIPVNKPGFGVQNTGTATKAEANIAKGRSAGGIKITSIAAGASAVGVSAAFSSNNALMNTTAHDEALAMQDSIAASLTGINEIQASLEDRKKEQQLLNLKSFESRLLSSNKRISNVLDTFKMFQLKLPESAMSGAEPIPCGMAMPGYAYDIGHDGNEPGTEIEGHDDFDNIDICVY